MIYTIRRYRILKARDKYRVVDHPFRIGFIDRTVVLPVTPNPPGLPMIAHNALPLSELEKHVGINTLMSGCLTETTRSAYIHQSVYSF